MKPLSYYNQTSVSFPKKDDYLTTYYYKKGRLVSIKSGNCFDEDFKVPKGCVEEHSLDEVSYKSHLNLYHEELRRLQDEFKDDLIKKYSMQEHIMEEECFNLAWEFGSGNLEDVEYYFEHLHQLILKHQVMPLNFGDFAAA